jgi:hypothetical protein
MLPENVPMLVETAVGSSIRPAMADGARDIRQADTEAITKARNLKSSSSEEGWCRGGAL